MKKNNPFTLSFGRQPAEYISRYENVEMILSAFDGEYPISQTFLIEGVRGSGKTVLMTAIENALLNEDEWVIVDLNATQDLMQEMRRELVNVCRRFSDLLKSGFSISVAGFGVGVNGAHREEDAVSEIEDILTFLKRQKKKVLIALDEVVQGENMRRFASQFQIWIRREYPVFLLMTGLYENIYAIQNDPSLTFLLRTPKVHLEPLSIHQITRLYAKVFDLDEENALHLARLTKGYAFAFQALGMLYYEYNESESLDQILLRLDDMLDDFVYKKIWETLSVQDRAVVCCLSDQNPTKVKDACERLGMTSSSFSKYRERLLKKGIIQAAAHGYISLLLPGFARICRTYE